MNIQSSTNSNRTTKQKTNATNATNVTQVMLNSNTVFSLTQMLSDLQEDQWPGQVVECLDLMRKGRVMEAIGNGRANVRFLGGNHGGYFFSKELELVEAGSVKMQQFVAAEKKIGGKEWQKEPEEEEEFDHDEGEGDGDDASGIEFHLLLLLV